MIEGRRWRRTSRIEVLLSVDRGLIWAVGAPQPVTAMVLVTVMEDDVAPVEAYLTESMVEIRQGRNGDAGILSGRRCQCLGDWGGGPTRLPYRDRVAIALILLADFVPSVGEERMINMGLSVFHGKVSRVNESAMFHRAHGLHGSILT